MIQSILDDLKLVRIKDITEENILILKGIHSIPKTFKDVKDQIQLHAQAKDIGYGTKKLNT